MDGFLSEIFVSFQGEGAHVGERHLFIRFAGCNLRCVYCDTPDSLERTEQYTVFAPNGSSNTYPNPVGAGTLAATVTGMLEDWAPVDAIALTGGEPLLQSDFLREFLVAVQPRVPVLLETNGTLPKRLAEIIDVIDVVSMDMKLPSNSGEAAFWDQHRTFLARSIAKHVYVKILVDERTSAAEVIQAGRLLKSEAPEIEAFLQPIMNAAGKPAISQSQLVKLYTQLREQHSRLRVVPQTHKLLGIR